MRGKNLMVIFLTSAMIFTCFGCREQRGGEDETTLSVTVSPEDTTCFDLVQNKVSEEDLLSFLDTSPSASELDQKFPIECFRRTTVPVWGDQIWATYRTDQGWILVYFYDDMEYSTYRTTRLESKTENLEQVEIGMSVDEVEAIDPEGDYWFRYGNKPSVSYHYTEDGKEYYVVYNGFFYVAKIVYVLI